MADIATIEIPNRALFKATEVCELLKVQPYVLRTWEAEFPELGIVRSAGGPRVYRRGDVEQVMRIRHLLLVEGLTLAGARRKMEEDADVAAPVGPTPPMVEERLGKSVRERLTSVKRGLRSLLDLLNAPASRDDRAAAPPSDFQLAPPSAPVRSARASTAPPSKAPKGGSAASRTRPSPRRKHSA